jgi:O2-independent ubiquinone biosynthesis accessory factor UbiT
MQLPECPPFVAAVLRRLPSWPPSFALATALNKFLAPQLPQDVRRQLAQRRLRIEVRDAGLTLDFTWTGERFAALPKQTAADLTIAATAPDFMRLARREEDPDTLFFSRRLSMQGDTELGLLVKNTLDALELPVFDMSHFKRQGTPHKPWQN